MRRVFRYLFLNPFKTGPGRRRSPSACSEMLVLPGAGQASPRLPLRACRRPCRRAPALCPRQALTGELGSISALSRPRRWHVRCAGHGRAVGEAEIEPRLLARKLCVPRQATHWCALMPMFIRMSMHVPVPMSIRMFVQVSIRMPIDMHWHISIHISTNMFIHMSTYMSIYMSIHMFIHMSMHIFLHTYLYTCIYPCLYTCMYPCLYTCVDKCLYTYLHTCLYTSLYTCLCACL